MALRGLGTRVVRFGDHGPEVEAVQRALLAWGYEPGPVDGRFGDATLDAVLTLQREHRLRIDGKVGHEVRALLFAEGALPERQVHVVRKGERWVDLSRRYNVSVEALRRGNRRLGTRLYAGARVVVRSREVYALLLPGGSLRHVAQRHRSMTGLIVSAFAVDASGGLSGSWDDGASRLYAETGLPLVCGVSASGPEGERGLLRLLSSVRTRRAFRKSLAASEPQAGAFLFDFPRVPWGYGWRFMRFITDLAAQAADGGKGRFLTVPHPREAGMLGTLVNDIDYRRLGAAFDRLLFPTHLPAARMPLSTPDAASRLVSRLRPYIPGWKTLLGIPVGGRLVHPFGEARWVGHARAIAMAYVKGAGRPQRDERTGLLHSRLREGEAEVDLWLEHPGSFEARLRLVEQYNLAGCCIYPAGMEEPRTWDILARRCKVRRDPGACSPVPGHIHGSK